MGEEVREKRPFLKGYRRIFTVILVAGVVMVRPDIGAAAAVLLGTVAMTAIIGLTKTDLPIVERIIGAVEGVGRKRGGDDDD